MRADRLVATLLLLQARGRVTAAEVAAELEVSLKTARRDLEALSLAGLPVYSHPGRGGGWQLLGGARTDLSGLTAAEARALFLVAGPAATVTPQARSALRKLTRALPAPFRAGAEAAAAATVLDPAGWGMLPAAAAPPHLAAVQRAVIDRVQIQIDYEDAAGTTGSRLVHPLGVAAKGERWYLVADTVAGRRTFRVDRIRALTVTDRPAIRPEGFALDAAWGEIAAVIDERRTLARAVLHVDAAMLGGLREQFGTDLVVGTRLSQHAFEVTISGASFVELAERLAGWGNVLHVVGPEEIRRHLARIGAELVAMYALNTALPARPPDDASDP